MIDTHCHILPTVDDGSDSMPTSMMMAAMAADSGVRTIVCTPHLTWDENRGKTIPYLREAFRNFSKVLSESRIPIALYFGAEVLLPMKGTFTVTEDIPHIGDTDYVLAEFYFDDRGEHMKELLTTLVAAGLRPIVAHPERYDAIQKDKTLARSMTELGAYLQINKGSFLGGFGKKARAAALRMMDEGLVSLVGSDAHDTVYRTTEMQRACEFLYGEYGEDALTLLTSDNPKRLLQNLPMERNKKK